LAIGGLVVGGVAGCSNDSNNAPRNELAKYNSDVVVAWFKLFTQITQTEKLTPPVASRAFGYEGVALYESVVGGWGTHQSLVGQLNGLTTVPQPISVASYHWPTVANAALATLARQIYDNDASQASLELIDQLETSFNDQYAPVAGTSIFNRSVEYGKSVGDAIYEWSATDGRVQLNNCIFNPPTGQGLWVPTPPSFAPPQQPCWGDLRNFVLSTPGDCAPPPPPPFDDRNPQAPFYLEAKEVFDVGNHLTTAQHDIALFWADGGGTSTPPGHWMDILSQLTVENDWTLDITAEAYCRLGLAQGDAFISCWRTKYRYNFIRPITCIRTMFAGSWSPAITTPPFPEYTSGHSVQSAASAEVLTDLFGIMPFTDSTHNAQGMAPRQFSNFFDAANEAAISRLYAGIHFHSAINKGLEQGTCIGQQVSALNFTR
jgi:hypothetical protein